MDIWSVTICLRHSQQAFRLYYKSEAKAELTFNRLQERDWSGTTREIDDIGNHVAVQLGDMSAVAMTKINSDIEINGEIGLMQAIIQQRMQKRLQADPSTARFAMPGSNIVS